MSGQNSPKNKKRRKKAKKDARLINFLLTSEQEENLNYNINTLHLARNRTDYFINKITEDYKTQGKGYRKETPNDVATKEYVDKSNDLLFQKLQKQLQTNQIMLQSIIDREEGVDKTQKLAKIEQSLFSYKGLARLDTYDKLEGYLVKQFPKWESDLIEEKIYYELVSKFLKDGDVTYNQRLKKFVWSVPDE